MKSNLKFTLPEGADKNLLKRFLIRSAADEKKRFNIYNDTLVKRAKLFASQKKPSENELKEISKHFLEVKKSFSKEIPPGFIPLKGHNPAVYAPFDFSSFWTSVYGTNVPSGGGYAGLELFGPDKTSGLIGSYIYNLTSPGYLISTISKVGFLYYASADGTLCITAQAHLNGYAESVNADVFSGLVLSSEHFISTPRRRPISTAIDIYRYSKPHISSLSNTDIIRTSADFREGEGRTLTLLTPVRKFNWYIISVTAKQHLLGIGVCGFKFFVGPISHTIV